MGLAHGQGLDEHPEHGSPFIANVYRMAMRFRVLPWRSLDDATVSAFRDFGWYVSGYDEGAAIRAEQEGQKRRLLGGPPR